jgi:hypothetical protein
MFFEYLLNIFDSLAGVLRMDTVMSNNHSFIVIPQRSWNQAPGAAYSKREFPTENEFRQKMNSGIFPQADQ